MSDLRIQWRIHDGDWTILPPGLELDDTLLSSVIISLFSDRRANDGDELPDDVDRRGWWGDVFAEDGDQVGSRLWLLARSKMTPETLRRAKEYSVEALAWLLTDKVAKQVEVTTEAVDRDVLGIGVKIQLKDDTVESYLFKGGLNAV